MRQDHDRALDHGPPATPGWADPLPGTTALGSEGLPARGADGVPGPDGRAQPEADDLRVRGGRSACPPHPWRAERRDRGATGCLGSVTGGPPAARALLPLVPARTLRGPA